MNQKGRLYKAKPQTKSLGEQRWFKWALGNTTDARYFYQPTDKLMRSAHQPFSRALSTSHKTPHSVLYQPAGCVTWLGGSIFLQTYCLSNSKELHIASLRCIITLRRPSTSMPPQLSLTSLLVSTFLPHSLHIHGLLL